MEFSYWKTKMHTMLKNEFWRWILEEKDVDADRRILGRKWLHGHRPWR